MSEGFPPEYRLVLERYYRRLAEEKTVADRSRPAASQSASNQDRAASEHGRDRARDAQRDALLLIALTAAVPARVRNTPARSASSALDQAAFDAETYGEKAGLKREADGLRMTLAPGEAETGWKTPQQIRFGGDFTISATVVIKTLPKPAQEDGAAVGHGDRVSGHQPARRDPAAHARAQGPDVYRFIDKAAINTAQQQQQQMQMQMQMQQGLQCSPAANRRSCRVQPFPASGDQIRLQIQREGQIVRFQVVDVATGVATLPGPGPASGRRRRLGEIVRRQPQRGRGRSTSSGATSRSGPTGSSGWARS